MKVNAIHTNITKYKMVLIRENWVAELTKRRRRVRIEKNVACVGSDIKGDKASAYLTRMESEMKRGPWRLKIINACSKDD